jgi:pimeloyl-ACP methyl ester carboxylesterase
MQLKYLSFGQIGKNIVFLHGWQQDKRSFSSLVPFLYKQYQLYLVDLPGFGQTPMPKTDSSFKEYCQIVVSWLNQKKISPVILVGHSFGGKMASLITALHPELIEKLILIAPSAIAQPKFWYPLKDRLPKKLIKLISPILKPFIVSRDYQNAGNLLPLFKTFVKEDLRPYFSEIKVPTLLLWGKQDEELSLAHARVIHRLIPNSRLEIIPGGHSFFQTQPEETARLIDNFIRK